MQGKTSTVFDCNMLHLPKITSRQGSISTVENLVDIPFEIKRVYYLYDVPGKQSRGAHAHRDLKQLLIAASGSFDIILDDGGYKKTVNLDRPFNALFIPPGIWRDLTNFSTGSICLVLCSHNYDEADYIRDYDVYKSFKNG